MTAGTRLAHKLYHNLLGNNIFFSLDVNQKCNVCWTNGSATRNIVNCKHRHVD